MSKTTDNKMFGNKKSKLSVLPIIFSSVLAAGALAGSAVSIWHVSKNYQESSEFKKTYNARINVDPVAFESNKSDKTLAENNLKESAKRLSDWLKYSGAESYDVSYELGEADKTKGYTDAGWLSAYYTVEKVKVKHVTSEEEKDQKIENDPYLSYFNKSGFNSNNKTLVYRWYTQEATDDKIMYSVLDFKDVFEMPTDIKSKDNLTKTLVDKDGKNGVMFKIKPNTLVNDMYNDMKQAVKDTKDDPKTNKKTLEEWQKPRFYIINNLEGMFNEINYHLANYANNLVNPTSDYGNIYDGTDYQKFVQLIRSKDKKNKDRYNPELKFKLDSADIHVKEGEAAKTIENGEVFHYLDLAKSGTVESSILNKYVDKIYKFEDSDFQKFFPDKITDTYTNGEPSKEGATVNLQYAWFEKASKNEANQYLEQTTNYGLKCKICNINIHDTTTGAEALTAIKKQVTSRNVPPKFVDSLFGGNNLVGILSLGFLIYLILLLIILAVLYRTTGVMSWICMMFMLSMSGLIALSGSMVISMSFLFGLFTLSLIGMLAALAVCGRIKRRILSNEDTSVAVIKGLKKSLWPLVDISFITLIFGICATYIAPLGLNALGIMLITGSFATFISMYLLNGLLQLLFFNNGLTMNKFKFLGKPSNKANEALAQSNSQVPSSMDATKLEFAFYDRFSLTKVKLIDLKTLIILGVFAALMIAGIIVFGVNGWANNSLFHSSMCIYLNESNAGLVMEKMPQLLKYSSYQHFGSDWYFFCDAIDQTAMDAIKTQFASAQFANVVGNTNKDLLNFAMISVIAGAAIVSAYAGFRCNWTAFVPMLVGSMLMPILILGIAAMCQIKFDQNVVLGFVLVVVINSAMSCSIISAINDSWFRKESYNADELKFIVTTGFKNCFKYIIVVAIAYLLFVTAFGITSPIGLSQVTYLMLIGAIVTIIVTPIAVSYLLYWFLLIRSKWLTKRAEKLASKVYVNLDDIDEQSIEGINKFTKQRAYAKKQQGANQ